MPELETKVPFEVRCAHCGFGLCALTHVDRDNNVTVHPCPQCLKAAREEGYDEGHKDGHAEGYDHGVEASDTTPLQKYGGNT